MKAIILAAGQGLRLRPLTDHYPKCMVEYKGKQIIDYILETMRSVGLNDIAIVKGYRADVLIKEGTKSFINDRYDVTNMVTTLFCSEGFWDEDLIISYADIIYEPKVLEALIADSADFSVVVDKDWKSLWEKRMEDPLADAETLKINDKGFIKELGKKPKGYEDIEGQYIGLIKIRKQIIQEIRDFYYGLNREAIYDGKDFDNMFMTSFIQLIIDKGIPVKPVFISGGWIEIDTLEDLKNLS